MTPMMQQYFDVKRELPKDTLLFFRLGDFFELFFDDAVIASKVLGLTLTKRHDQPMAGIPAHAADTYISKLLAAGKKVAICDQKEPATPGKLVKRELTRILTPGTTLAANQLDASRNRYLAALFIDRSGIHASWLDLSTGEFRLASDAKIENLLPILSSLNPDELLIAEGELEKWKLSPHENTALHALHGFASTRLCTELPATQFSLASGSRAVMATLGVLNLEGFGLKTDHPALGPAGALVRYATENLCAKPENLRTLQEYHSKNTILLDPSTLRNLEIFTSSRGTKEGSLLHAINRTSTSPGSRLLERWLAAPSLDIDEIKRRQTLIGAFILKPTELSVLKDLVIQVRDIPRILGRLQNKLRSPRELGGVRDTLSQIPAIKKALTEFKSSDHGLNKPIDQLLNSLHEQNELSALLARALSDELPQDLEDGNYIKQGYDEELDRLRNLTSENKTWLADLEKSEQDKTGIRSLKVRFTNNFGYYIEVTKANLHLVPADYIRRQTTVNGERYVTEDLRKKEKEIFSAEENAIARERLLFQGLVDSILNEAALLSESSATLAECDVLSGWALLAREWDYCKPAIDESSTLEITEGRHPVVEQMLRSSEARTQSGSSAFVPNSTRLSCQETQIALITGPNMAGKSTYIRQVALIALLAHIGSYVPAKACRMGLIDRIFSRVGASDDLARGNSTFMVEMNETANILNNATDKSLIILDEIGRGTSTYDGLSIAWAVVEHLHRSENLGPRTLFATHYQELTQLDKYLPRLKNFCVEVKEYNDDIVFVRRVIQGAADRSYGIQVARLAGLPLSVIDRARTILSKLESDDTTVTIASPAAKPKKKITVASQGSDSQLNLL